jgi:predicted kinase
VSSARVILITGLPGTGKTTLARTVAVRYRLPLLAKDLIKEPLLDALGAVDSARSRELSTLSFTLLFAMAREVYSAGMSMLLEGNFRPGEHEEAMRCACASLFDTGDGGGFCQILCTLAEPERLARLSRRQSDPSRHAGHRDDSLVTAVPAARGDTFLDLPGARLLHDGTDDGKVMSLLDSWWNSRTV